MNPQQIAAFRRKIFYLASILVLFTISMFWRGIIPIPLSGSARASEARSAIQRVADRINNASILNQASALDLRELDQGESEVEGSLVQLSLIGIRGCVTTYLWFAIIDKQKRNDFHEMEELIRVVIKLQPHFVAPWIFQSWNISYNVSVEMQGSGDMYHYIARGIELLAEGERRNSHMFQGRKIGSPDMRYQIAFYYQNKFGVSDQVEVLRCLFELSCMSKDDRDPKNLIDSASGTIDLPKFREFCEKYPHFVRRLRGEDFDAARSDEQTKKRVQEALKCPRPGDIIQFLKENRDVPSRYVRALELADADKQFPVLPPKFDEREADPEAKTDDNFTAYLAARAWFTYSLVPLPPNPRDIYDEPLPSTAPRPASPGKEVKQGEYDPFLYRVPHAPMLIIFRQGAPRAQTYQAELQQKEGWFDNRGWRIDDPQDQPQKWWFPDPDAPPGVSRPLDIVVGKQQSWSLEDWQSAAQMIQKVGQETGLILSPERKRRYEEAAQGPVNSLPLELSESDNESFEARARHEARMALFFYAQNRSVTNFPYFLASSEAEAHSETVEARRLLWQADQARKLGQTPQAIRLYAEGLKQWKAVLARYPDFHRPERSDRTEEDTYGYELAYIRLLVQDDASVRAQANRLAQDTASAMRLAGCVLPFQPFPFQASMPAWSRDTKSFFGSAIMQACASQYAVPEWKKDALEDFKWSVAESMSPFAKPIGDSPDDGVVDPERRGLPWIKQDVKNAVLSSQGVQRKPSTPTPSTPVSSGAGPEPIKP